MSDTSTPLPSLADRVRAVDAGGTVVGVHFLGKHAGVRAGRGGAAVRRRRTARSASPSTVAASWRAPPMARASSPAAMTASSIATDADGATNELAADDKQRWIDQVALAPDGAVAWSAGKTAHVLTGKGERRARSRRPRPSAGLAFAPKGLRLAIAHYNGATLWFPNAAGAAPEKLEWKGSHLGVSLQPGRQIPRHRHAGADAARLAARRRQAHAHVGLFGARALASAGPRTANISPPPAPSSSSCGRSTARTGPWASSRGCWRNRRRACRSSLAIRASRWRRSAMPTAWWCWCVSTTVR